MTGKRGLLDPDTLFAAIEEIAEIAKTEHTRVVLIGGFAMQHYGSVRLTGDIDVIADRRLESLPIGRPRTFGGEATVTFGGVPVDVVLRVDEYAPLYEEAANRAQRLPGIPILVARPEHLAIMKLAAGRRRDEDDLEFLITEVAIDLAETRRIARTYLGPYGASALDRFVEIAQWRFSKR